MTTLRCCARTACLRRDAAWVAQPAARAAAGTGDGGVPGAPGARVRRARPDLPVVVDPAADRRVDDRPARGARAAPVVTARLPAGSQGILRLPDRPGLRLGRRVRAPLRHPPGAGGPRVERRGTRARRRVGPGPARVHPRRAADLLRSRRRPGRADPRRRPQGLARRVPRRHPVQGRLRVRAAPQRGPDARSGRLRRQPPRPRVRRLRCLLRPPRQGDEGLPTQAAQRVDRVAVDRRRPRRVDQHRPTAARPAAAPTDQRRAPPDGRCCWR